MAASLKALPTSFRKLVVTKLTPIFRDAVAPVTETLIKPELNQVLVKNRFVGINASDVNVAAGRYHKKDIKLPFDIGFEGVGEIVAHGEKVSDIKLGQAVMYMGLNAFSEYVYLPKEDVIPIPSARSDFIPLLVSGATASLSLDKAGQIIPGDKVLITAAAGGTGHIAVQWAKEAGCHVIGLCSTKEKCDYLKTIGCDRPINYKEESLESILKTEYPSGVDVVWETVGGTLFDLLLNHLSVKGRLVAVGAMSSYSQKAISSNSEIQDIPLHMLLRSASLSGFFLFHYKDDIPHYLTLLVRMMHEEKLQLLLDTGNTTKEGKFNGLTDIVRAVEYLHSGQNKGKVIVTL